MDCDYCEEEFESEDSYLTHLNNKHKEKMSRIERKKYEKYADDDSTSNLQYIAVGVGSLAILVIVYFILTSGGSDGSFTDITPGYTGSSHIHGNIQVVVNGERIDFSSVEYQLRDEKFHFEGGDGERWHVHATDVTLGYSMNTVGIKLYNNSYAEFEGESFSEERGDTVEVIVNGEEVNPSTYVLKDGDQVRIKLDK